MAVAPSCSASSAPQTTSKAPRAQGPDGKTKAPQAAPVVVPDADLRVKRLVLARGVNDREPVEPGATFSLDEAKQLYAFVEVTNPDQVESEIVVTFEPDGGPAVGHVTLRVGASPRWRTWAYTRGARTAGSWVAVVRNAEGELLARKPFEITS